jgi:MFS family permease
MNRSPGDKDFKVGGWGARGVLITCSLLYLVNNMDRYVLAVVMQPMKEALGLTDAQAGSLQTAFFLGMMAFSLPVSYLIDRWSRRKAIAVMAIVWSAFTFITGLGKSYLGVLVPRTIVGVGEAAFAAGGTAWITGVYPPESRGRVLGIFNMLMVAGASLGFILGGLISKRMGGWQYPFFVFAIPGILLGVLAFFMRDYRTVRHVDDRGNEHGFVASVSMLLKIPTLRWLYVGFGLRSFVNWALLSWLTAYFMRSRGIAEDEAGLAMGATALMSIFGPAIGGVLADRWHKRNPKGRMLLLATSDLLSAVCAIAALLLNAQGAGYLLICAWAAIAMVGIPALSAVTQDVAEPANKTLSFGLAVFCSYLLGGAWGPVVVGAISDGLGGGAEGLRNALIIVCLAGFVAAYLEWRGSLTYPADMDKVKGVALQAER